MHDKQLDSLRAFAVAGVFYTHMVDDSTPFGTWGVRLFFVLSGFLITRILIEAKPETGADAGQSLFAFYARRALRILPAYFAALGLMAIVFWSDVRTSLPWHVFFASNIWFSLRDAWEPWFFAHLWSLSVEEQFYLIWPLLMILSPRRALASVCLGGMALSVVFRLIWPSQDGEMTGSLLLPAALDALGAGALLAVCRLQGVALPRWAPWVMAGVGAVSLVIMTSDPEALDILGPRAGWIASSALPLLLFVPLIGGASKGFGGIGGVILELAPLRWLGRISYGLYLYHMPVLALAIALAHRHLIPHALIEPGLLRLAAVGGATTLVATLSWLLMERPINGLKRYFSYRPPSGSLITRAPQTQAAG